MDSRIIERLKKEIESFSQGKEAAEVGVVQKVGDGIVEIEGLEKASMAEMVRFDESSVSDVKTAVSHDGDLFGVILNLEEDTVKAIVSQALFFERRAHLRDRPQMSA